MLGQGAGLSEPVVNSNSMDLTRVGARLKGAGFPERAILPLSVASVEGIGTFSIDVCGMDCFLVPNEVE